MTKGRILVAENDGVYLLKLTGDVRVTLCASIADYLERIFSGETPDEVYVDLFDAEGVDSTTLGLLARLALYTEEKFGFKTRLLCDNPSILRVFEAMDIDSLFEVLGTDVAPDLKAAEIDPGEPGEEELRQQVLEAHKLLVKLNPELMGEFYDLISSLESRQ